MGDLGRLVLHIDARPLWESLGALGRLGECLGNTLGGQCLGVCFGAAGGMLREGLGNLQRKTLENARGMLW